MRTHVKVHHKFATAPCPSNPKFSEKPSSSLSRDAPVEGAAIISRRGVVAGGQRLPDDLGRDLGNVLLDQIVGAVHHPLPLLREEFLHLPQEQDLIDAARVGRDVRLGSIRGSGWSNAAADYNSCSG